MVWNIHLSSFLTSSHSAAKWPQNRFANEIGHIRTQVVLDAKESGYIAGVKTTSTTQQHYWIAIKAVLRTDELSSSSHCEFPIRLLCHSDYIVLGHKTPVFRRVLVTKSTFLVTETRFPVTNEAVLVTEKWKWKLLKSLLQ